VGKARASGIALEAKLTLTERVPDGPASKLDQQLRLSVNNLLGEDDVSGRVVQTDGLAQGAHIVAATYAVRSVKLETKF
jgi:hypothetical protein